MSTTTRIIIVDGVFLLGWFAGMRGLPGWRALLAAVGIAAMIWGFGAMVRNL